MISISQGYYLCWRSRYVVAPGVESKSRLFRLLEEKRLFKVERGGEKRGRPVDFTL